MKGPLFMEKNITTRGLKGKLIKHDKAMDLCFQVVSIYEGSSSYKVKGYFYNMGFVSSYNIFPYTSNIVIKKQDLVDNWKWTFYDTECVRFNEWKPIK